MDIQPYNVLSFKNLVFANTYLFLSDVFHCVILTAGRQRDFRMVVQSWEREQSGFSQTGLSVMGYWV